MANSYKKIKSVERTIAILKFMAQEVQPVSSKEITQAMGEPHSTIMCHLATLEAGGFIRKVYDRYELGLYLATIKASVRRSRETTREQAQRDLQELETV